MAKPRIRIRRWTSEDIPRIVEVQTAAWSEYPPSEQYDERMYGMQLSAFPEGQFLAELDGHVVAYATAEIVQLEADIESYTFNELTGSGTFSTHDPAGDTLYGTDIAVHPDFRGQGIAAKLYGARKRLLKRYNLRRMIAFGRIPGYREVAGQLTAQEYVNDVVAGLRSDMALTAHVKAGYEVKQVRLDLMSDRASANWATLLEMRNPVFDAHKRRLAAVPISRSFRRARVCAAQYAMRAVASWEDVAESIGFFIDAANEYHCHFLVLPELFTAQLLSAMPEKSDPRAAFRKLATYHEQYVETLRQGAMRAQVYIIGGTHPVLRDGTLYNVAHLFTPAGNVYTQDKLHITPSERELWNIRPGSGLKVFESPFGKFSILVCYDIEFPELARMVTMAGSEVLFVPYSTDDRKAYRRVRYAAQARAIENASYVVIAGNTGNLRAGTYLLNFSQSAILTPSDFGFPPDAIAAEAEPNVETVTIGDLDFATLSSCRSMGSVRPLQDMRADIYELNALTRVERIRIE